MTRLPHESRLVIDRPDLPEYELNKACPITGEVTGLENHHLWRRRDYPSYWVELPTGEIVGNRIMLSSQAHYRVTVNKARISYVDGVFRWVENDEWTALCWQPPHFDEGEDLVYRPDYSVGGHEKFEMPVITIRDSVEPGHDCPTCKRRVPIPKKKTSPTTKVFSCRVPLDDVDEFNNILDGVADGTGLKSQPHYRYWTLLYGLIALGQLPEGELPRRG